MIVDRPSQAPITESEVVIFFVGEGGASAEPNIFPDVHDLDARDAGSHVVMFLDVKIEGKHTPVTVQLSYEQASDLATLLEPF